MSPSCPDFRVLTAADIPFGMHLKAQAGWNQLEGDWRRCLDLEPEGCFLASLAGQPVGTVTTCRFEPAGCERVGWIGMLLVEASCRGKGIGTALLHRAMGWLREQGMTTIRLDASEMGRPIYEKHGFVTRYLVYRYRGRADLPVASMSCEAIPFSDLAQLDRATLTVPRDALLRALCAQSEPRGLRDAHGWRGYGLARPGSTARQIGPIVARDPECGAALITELCRGAGADEIFIDVPEPNVAARACAEAIGLRHARTFWRMDHGPAPRERLEHYWACTGPEKG